MEIIPLMALAGADDVPDVSPTDVHPSGTSLGERPEGGGASIASTEQRAQSFEEHRRTWSQHCPVTKESEASVE